MVSMVLQVWRGVERGAKGKLARSCPASSFDDSFRLEARQGAPARRVWKFKSGNKTVELQEGQIARRTRRSRRQLVVPG